MPGALDALEAATTIPLPAGGDDDTPVSLHALGLPGTTTLARARALQQAARSGEVTAIALGGEVGAGRLHVRDEFDPVVEGPMSTDTSGAAQLFQHRHRLIVLSQKQQILVITAEDRLRRWAERHCTRQLDLSRRIVLFLNLNIAGQGMSFRKIAVLLKGRSGL